MSKTMGASPLRSNRWFGSADETGIRHRSVLATLGYDPAHVAGRPVIGICNPRSELNNCELVLGELATAVKRGVLEAGGVPLEFGAMPLGAELLKPSDLLYRNLVAMEVEETLRAYPIDGVVLLCNCDKTAPAQLMAAASADLPAIQLSGGPKSVGYWRDQPVSSGTDFWKVWDDYRDGRVTDEELRQLEKCLSCSAGACNEMGSASTIAAMSEALGMMPSGTCAIPANDSRRLIAGENAGRRIVQMVKDDLRPSAILTPAAFENAIHVLMAIGGSTNAIIHLIAIAGRRGIRLPLELFDRIARVTPTIVNLKPAGRHLMADLHRAGGLPAVMREIRPHLHLDCPTVTGATIGEIAADARTYDGDVIRPIENPIAAHDTLVVLRGNLAPDGAILKAAAASAELMTHTGPAVVFDDYADMLARIDRDELNVAADSVLVLRNAGPVGVPGMPEWGNIPVPRKLLRKGIRDVVRISDGRMSGTAYGTVVLHASPEAAAGGTLAVVRDGDPIRLDVASRSLELLVPEREINARLSRWSPRPCEHRRGYVRLFHDHVLQAHEGCDLDFLRPGENEGLNFVEPIIGRT